MRKLTTISLMPIFRPFGEYIRNTPPKRMLALAGMVILGITFPGVLHTQELTQSQVFTRRLVSYQEALTPPAIFEIPKNAPTLHTVRRGNTFNKIAKSYGTTVDAIFELNNLSPDNELVAGQILKVPSSGEVTISWYGTWFNGRIMANAEPYYTTKLVIAHRYLPLGTCVAFTNPQTGDSVVATVQDRIAERYAHRWDVSPRVFRDELGFDLRQGLARVAYKVVECNASGPLARAS